MALLLTADDVRDLLADIDEVIDAMAAAHQEHARGSVVLPVRLRLPVERHAGTFVAMPGYLDESGVLGIRIGRNYPRNPDRGLPSVMSTAVLADPATGVLQAIIDATPITTIRTAATTAMATRLLANEGPAVLGLIGSGVQARAHVPAIRAVRPISRAVVWSRTRSNAERLARDLEAEDGLAITVVDAPEQVAREADILVTATNADDPLIHGEWLRPGMHLNVVGYRDRNSREIDSEAVRRCRLVADTRGGLLSEGGEVLRAIQDGVIDETHVTAEIGEILAGSKPGRANREEITLYRSLGVAIQDLAAAGLVYRKARAQGRGIEIPI